MDSGKSAESWSSDFGFAFNDSNFSDRVLLIEIAPDSPGSKPDSPSNPNTLADWALRNRKRRRHDLHSSTGNSSIFSTLGLSSVHVICYVLSVYFSISYCL